jgi:hypothetical protein
MNDLENRLRDAFAEADVARNLSGPALRRSARSRSVQVRFGGLAVVGATAAAAVVVGPGLLTSHPSTTAGSFGSSSTDKPTPPSATPAASTPGPAVPVQAYVWNPAGTFVADPGVLAAVPKAVGEWNVPEGKPVLDPRTVSVLYADRVTLDDSGPQWPRPLVIVSGRTSTTDPTLRLVALSTISGGQDSVRWPNLIPFATSVPDPAKPQVMAVAWEGLAVFVAAENGISSASYDYTDAGGEHTASMTLEKGVATALVPNGTTVTHVTATSGTGTGRVTVWDGPPTTAD